MQYDRNSISYSIAGDIMTASMLPEGKGRFYDGVANSGGKTIGYSYNQGGKFCYDGTKIYTDIVYDLGAVYDMMLDTRR